MDKYKNKYRIQSHRRPGWDYSANGMYFITLVTQNRECHLGKITDGKMEFSDWGIIIKNEWLESFEIRQELFLDEYTIMPDHLHAIVVMDKSDDDRVVDSHGNSHPPNSSANHNPFHHLSPDSNRPSIQKSTIILMNIN